MLTAASFRPAIAAALAAAGLAALTGCSTYATDKPNVIANGGYGTSSDSPYGQLRVDGAVIVAQTPTNSVGPASKGVFTATLTIAPQVNGATVSQATIDNLALTALVVDTSNPHLKSSDTVTASFAPVSVKVTGVENAGTRNMANPAYGGIAVTGSFIPGDVVPIELTLAKGQTVHLEVPVVKACGLYQFVVAKPALSTSPEVTAYNNYIAGIVSVPTPSETANPGTYECATPILRASQGAAPDVTTHASAVGTNPAAKPTASASKH